MSATCGKATAVPSCKLTVPARFGHDGNIQLECAAVLENVGLGGGSCGARAAFCQLLSLLPDLPTLLAHTAAHNGKTVEASSLQVEISHAGQFSFHKGHYTVLAHAADNVVEQVLPHTA